MIAFSCVHCGQRMTITREDGGKRATCPDCRQAVTIPDNEAGRRRGSASRAEPAPEVTRITHKPASQPGTETYPEDRLPVHEEPTRLGEDAPEGVDLGFL